MPSIAVELIDSFGAFTPNRTCTDDAGNYLLWLANALASTAATAELAFTQTLYPYTNCNGLLDAGKAAVTAPVIVIAARIVCPVVRQLVPADARQSAQNVIILSVGFAYTNAAPALNNTLIATDVTAVGQAGALALSKLVNNVIQGGAASLSVNAMPGDTMRYSLNASNNGAQYLTTLIVNDAVPAFTTFLSAACPIGLPTGLSACSVTTQPAPGGQGPCNGPSLDHWHRLGS